MSPLGEEGKPESESRLSLLWPLVAATAVLLTLLAVLFARSLRLTESVLTYALDDPYIHTALAKNLASSGVLGVTPFEFNSASSSPLWTALLTLGFLLFGVHKELPLVLCVLSAIGVIALADHLLTRFGLSAVWRLVGLLTNSDV